MGENSPNLVTLFVCTICFSDEVFFVNALVHFVCIYIYVCKYFLTRVKSMKKPSKQVLFLTYMYSCNGVPLMAKNKKTTYATSRRCYYCLPWQDSISRPITPQAETIPLDH
jgi:hypothetical protein